MKKLGVLVLCVVFMAFAGTTLAAWDFDDPALCVAGEWLLVDAAHLSAVYVVVPAGTAYGDQQQGECTTSAPADLLPPDQVLVQGHGEKMMVRVNGELASSTIKVTYGEVTRHVQNHGRTYLFKFSLPD